MVIKLNDKEYKSVKMTRKYYKIYIEAFKKLETKDIYEDEDLDLMVKTLVNLYDNKFVEEDINEELTVSDIIYNFMMLQTDETIELQNKINKAQKAFLKSK